MKKTFLRILLPILLVIALAATVTVIAIATNDDGEAYTDAMVDIRADEYLESKLLKTYSGSDGYLGIPVDFAIYHSGGTVDGGCNLLDLLVAERRQLEQLAAPLLALGAAVFQPNCVAAHGRDDSAGLDTL